MNDRDRAGMVGQGEETGWWDDSGRPAPFPEDFWMPDGTVNPDWQATTSGGPDDF